MLRQARPQLCSSHRAAARGTPLTLPPRCRTACRSQRSPGLYAEELLACESSGDWLRTFELLTEVRVLKVDGVPVDTLEAGVRTLARGGQWQRALDVLGTLQSQPGFKPSDSTVEALFAALASGQQGDRALELLQSLQGHASAPVLGRVSNAVIRTLARQPGGVGLERAAAMLERMAMADDAAVEPGTFAAVAVEYIKLGQQDKAEEILEMRDYL